MTLEEKGAYMELLMMQFNRGHMTSHMIGQVIGQLWDKVKHKFKQDKDGLWYNERLELEQEKRKKFSDSRRNNVSGVNQYSKSPKKTEGHMTSHMENEDEIENRNRNIPTLDQVKEFIRNSNYDVDAKLIFDYYDELNWHDSKGNPVKNWKNKIRTVWFKPERKKPHRPY